MISFRIEPSPAAFHAKLWGRRDKFFSDYRPAWRRIAPMIGEQISQNVLSGGSAIGESWPALQPESLRGRRRGDALNRSGKLLRTVKSRSGVTMKPHRLNVAPRDRGHFVQNYGSQKRGIPARKYLALPPPMLVRIEAIVNDYTDELLAVLTEEMGKR